MKYNLVDIDEKIEGLLFDYKYYLKTFKIPRYSKNGKYFSRMWEEVIKNNGYIFMEEKEGYVKCLVNLSDSKVTDYTVTFTKELSLCLAILKCFDIFIELEDLKDYLL